MTSSPVPRDSLLPLMLLAPPYVAAVRVAELPASPGATLPGCLVAVRAGESVVAAELCETFSSVRACYPWLPLVLWLRSPSARASRVAAAAVRLGARGVVFDGEPIYGTLRPLMTDPTRLAEDVLEWLPLCGLRTPPLLQLALREIFLDPFRYARLEQLFEAVSQSPRSVRARFHKRGLCSPRRWFSVARALRIALAVQGKSEVDLLHVALDLGLSDHSALSQQVYRAFGLRPSMLRGTLGWEWLMSRFLVRERAWSPSLRDRGGIREPLGTSTIRGRQPTFVR